MDPSNLLYDILGWDRSEGERARLPDEANWKNYEQTHLLNLSMYLLSWLKTDNNYFYLYNN